MARQHYALYGNVALQREFCPSCREFSFVINGVRSCCGETTTFESNRTRRMCETQEVRRQPTEDEKRQILQMQAGRCLYCQRLFNTAVIRKGRLVWLRVTWDHMVPYSYSQNNNAINFAAACQICNGLKGDLMFDSIEKTQAYLQALWDARDIDSEGAGVG